jgi:hypothetical protein
LGDSAARIVIDLVAVDVSLVSCSGDSLAVTAVEFSNVDNPGNVIVIDIVVPSAVVGAHVRSMQEQLDGFVEQSCRRPKTSVNDNKRCNVERTKQFKSVVNRCKLLWSTRQIQSSVSLHSHHFSSPKSGGIDPVN